MDVKSLFAEAKALGISEIEVYSSETTQTSVQLYNHNVDGMKSSQSKVFYVRGAYNGHLGAMYVENSEIPNEVILKTIIENASLVNSAEPYFIYEGDKEYQKLPELTFDFDKHTMAEKVALCKELSKEVESHEKVTMCPMVMYQEVMNEKVIVNSNGLNVSKKTGYAYLVCEAVAMDGEDAKNSYDVQIAKDWSQFNIKELAESCAKETVSQIGGAPIKSSHYKVVVRNSVMQSLLGAFGNFFSGSACVKHMSILEGKVGEKVFGDNITLIDDPFNTLAPDQDAFDDEGCASRVKTVVENGVFKTFLHSLKTAKMMGEKTTANGYKQGISGGVDVSPSNFYLAPGEKSFDELVELCHDGFYLTSVTGLHAGINPISGDFSVQSQGFEIKDGKIGRPVNLIVTAGNFKDLLNNVLEVGNDLIFKDEQIGSPSVLVKSLSISGN